MNLSGRNILGYALLPQILPRIRSLAQDGFGFVAYTIACVFQNAALLPAHHPYCNPVNMGKFGLRHVLAQAASNLKFSVRNIDQILIFAMVLFGTVLLFIQIALLGFAFFTQFAHASRMPTDPLTPLPTTFSTFFEVAPMDAENDISFMILDRMFGIPGLFGSCVDLNTPCLGDLYSEGGFAAYPYLSGLHDLFGHYSQGLLWVAAFILLYHVATMVAEMSETGSLFGRRFNHVWAPVRLVAAIGLLLPMTSPLTGNPGLNASQYITLYIAKWGSGMASNAWSVYVADITDPDTPLGPPASLLSKPQYPSANDLIQFLAVAQTCWWIYDDLYKKSIEAYVVRENGAAPTAMDLDTFMTTYTNLYDIQQWFNFGDIVIVFGEKDDNDPEYKKYKGNVHPYCGEISLASTRIVDGSGAFYDGIDEMTYRYIKELVNDPWYDTNTPDYTLLPLAQSMAQRAQNNLGPPTPPTSDDMAIMVNGYNTIVKQIVDDAYLKMTTPPITNTLWSQSATSYGWAGAALWYSKIAEINGLFAQSVFETPMVSHYPEILEDILKAKQKANVDVAGEDRFDPDVNYKDPYTPKNDKDRDIIIALNGAYKLFNDMQEQVQAPQTGNVAIDGINALFKKTALWSFRQNQDIHPLAALVGLGKSLLTNSVLAFGSGTAAGIIATLGKKSGLKQLGKIFSSVIITIAYIGFASGILLYYVVPFMPFIYFMFALLGWARTIFEAMIGMPLWAIAHLRYDGPGFPTNQSLFGYFVLIDIFIRPILIVFGLIASSVIFYAVAKTLNNIFDIVVSNLTGFDDTGVSSVPAIDTGSKNYKRNPVDEMAFTVIYVVTVYMIGTSCFKMIDLFPNTILRWMNSNAQGFASRHEPNESG